jgi:hypothetical protein
LASRAEPALGPRTLLLGAIAIVLFVAFITPVSDPDFWWHLRTGQWMLQNHSLPAHDLYTFTVPNHVWTDHEYLSEILMALVWAAGGAVLISLAFGIVTWLGWYCVWRASDGSRQPFVIAGAAIVLGVLAAGPIWGPRAQMITFALACLELLWLRRYLSGRSRAINWFPLLMVLWANLHSGWAVAFVILGVAIFAEALLWVWGRQPAQVAHLRRLVLITALSVGAVALTPHGLALYAYPFGTVFSPAQQSLIAEWFSPDFHQTYLQPLLVFILLLIAGFAWKRPSLFDLVLSLVLLGLALHQVRQTSIFVAASTPALIAAWSAAWHEDVRPRMSWFGRRGAGPQPALMNVLTVIVLLLVLVITATKIASGQLGERKAVAADFPVQAADWLAAHPDQVGTRMFNQYGWGGYLLDRFYPDPRRRVFIFGEAALMGDSLLYQYQDIQTLRPNWRQLLDRYRVDYIVYNRGQALDNVLRTQPGWKLVYQDSVAVIYVRTANTDTPSS